MANRTTHAASSAKKRLTVPDWRKLLKRTALPFVFALAVSTIIIAVVGFSPLEALRYIGIGAIGSVSALLDTLFRTTPILFTGLAFAVTARTGLLNIGVEGQLCAGALATAVTGVYMQGVPSAVHQTLALGAGVLAGGLCAALVAFLKIRFFANEFISSIMLNMIIINTADYLVSGPLRTAGDMPQTAMIKDTARLWMLSPKNQLTIAVLFGIALAIALWLFFIKTPFGYEMKVSGENLRAAKFAGIKTDRVVFLSLILSGMIGGLCGATIVMGSAGRYIADFSSGFGFEGIAVSTLAAGNPIGCIFSGLLFGAIKAGAVKLNIMTKTPVEIVGMIQALVIVFVAAPRLVDNLIAPVGWVCRKLKGAGALCGGGVHEHGD